MMFGTGKKLLTADFVTTVSDGRTVWVEVRTLKCDREPSVTGTVERLEVERQYWESQGVDWASIACSGDPGA